MEPNFKVTILTRIRLIKKYAHVLNGIDLSHIEVGDEFVVAEAVAVMLIREGWAEVVSGFVDPLKIVTRRSYSF
jgi:hypothetical protein